MESFGLAEVTDWLKATPARLGRIETGRMGDIRLVTQSGAVHSLVFVGVLNCAAFLKRISKSLKVLGPRKRWAWLSAWSRSWVDGPVPAEALPSQTRAELKKAERLAILGFEAISPEGEVAVWGEEGSRILVVVSEGGVPLLLATHRDAERVLPWEGELYWYYQIAGGTPHEWSVDI